MKDKIKKHPSMVNCSELEEICHPLDQLYNIDYFCHVKLDNKGNFSALGKNPEFVEHYLQEKYYNCDSHLSEIDQSVEFIIQDAVEHHGKTEQLFADCKAFGVNHVFTMLFKSENGLDAYHFGSSKENKKLNELYLRNLPLLRQYISYFKERVASNKKLLSAYNFKFQIDSESSSYESSLVLNDKKADIKKFIDQVKINKQHILDNKNNYLTHREIECLYWLHNGKTMDEIATIRKND